MSGIDLLAADRDRAVARGGVDPAAAGAHPVFTASLSLGRLFTPDDLALRRFLALRVTHRDQTWAGASSDALVDYATGKWATDRPRCAPLDYDDLDRCEQTYRLLPPAQRERAAAALHEFRAAVDARCGMRRRPVRPLSAAVAAAFGVTP